MFEIIEVKFFNNNRKYKKINQKSDFIFNILLQSKTLLWVNYFEIDLSENYELRRDGAEPCVPQPERKRSQGISPEHMTTNILNFGEKMAYVSVFACMQPHI